MNQQPGTTRPLRIALLAHNCRVAGGLSVGRNLVGAMGRQAPQHEYIVTIPPGIGYEEVCATIPRCRTIVCRAGGGPLGQMFFETFKLPGMIRLARPDVLLALGNRGLLKPPCPQALYIQDSHYCYPTRFFAGETWKSKLNKRLQGWLIARQLRRSGLMLCQTPVMERRAREAFGFTGRTAICPNAVSAFSIDGAADPGLPAPLAPHADKTRLFYVTKFYAHKNLEGIVECFDRYRDELRDVVAVLTVAPDQHPHAPKFLRSIEQRGLGDRIINVGPLPQSALAGYFRNCQGLLMPTFLESFSGTYLEAMHFGTPILTSDLDFARGICGDAAIYFDPWSPEAMKDAILRLRNTPGLAGELAAAGRARLASLFRSWDEVAAGVVKLLAEMVDTPEPPSRFDAGEAGL